MDEKGKVEIFEPFSFFRHLFASLEKKEEQHQTDIAAKI